MSSEASTSADVMQVEMLRQPEPEAGRCCKCDRVGCSADNPMCLFYGLDRGSHPDADIGDNVPHMRQVQWRMEGRDFHINGDLFFKGTATGRGNNCLIDSLRQQVSIVANANWVRSRLQTQFPRGAEKVTHENFLTLDYHCSAVIDALFIADLSGKPKLDSRTFKVVCVDLTHQAHGDVVGSGPRTLYIAREGRCHFAPLFRKQFHAGGVPNSLGVASTASENPEYGDLLEKLRLPVDQPASISVSAVERRPSGNSQMTSTEIVSTRTGSDVKSTLCTLPTNPKSWSIEHVRMFCSTELLFKDMADILFQNEVDGQVLFELTTAELRDDLNVKSVGRCEAMLRRIAELVAGSPGAKQEGSISSKEVWPPPHAQRSVSPRATKRARVEKECPSGSGHRNELGTIHSVQDILGHGTYGTVTKVFDTHLDRHVAVRTISKASFQQRAKQTKSVRQPVDEFDILNRLSHPQHSQGTSLS